MWEDCRTKKGWLHQIKAEIVSRIIHEKGIPDIDHNMDYLLSIENI